MNDKDTKLISEAYKKINEGGIIDTPGGEKKTIVQYKDDTSSYPQYADIIKHEDGTITISFGHSFTLSRLDQNSVDQLLTALEDIMAAGAKSSWESDPREGGWVS